MTNFRALSIVCEKMCMCVGVVSCYKDDTFLFIGFIQYFISKSNISLSIQKLVLQIIHSTFVLFFDRFSLLQIKLSYYVRTRKYVNLNKIFFQRIQHLTFYRISPLGCNSIFINLLWLFNLLYTNNSLSRYVHPPSTYRYL